MKITYPQDLCNALKSKIREKQESKSDDLIQNIGVILYIFFALCLIILMAVSFGIFFFLIEDTLCGAISFEI